MIFEKFFRDPVEEHAGRPAADDLAACHEAVAFGAMPYFETFLRYLDGVIDEPLKMTDQATLTASAIRQNAFKEVKRHLKSQVEKAAAVIAAAQEQ